VSVRLVRFSLGQLVATPGALELAQEQGIDVLALLGRHVSGDWGDVSAEDKVLNEVSVDGGLRLFSSYGEGAKRLWIITEADRSSTCACGLRNTEKEGKQA
jgi:hypothetical protein